jgi:hypothetical protein
MVIGISTYLVIISECRIQNFIFLWAWSKPCPNDNWWKKLYRFTCELPSPWKMLHEVCVQSTHQILWERTTLINIKTHVYGVCMRTLLISETLNTYAVVINCSKTDNTTNLQLPQHILGQEELSFWSTFLCSHSDWWYHARG